MSRRDAGLLINTNLAYLMVRVSSNIQKEYSVLRTLTLGPVGRGRLSRLLFAIGQVVMIIDCLSIHMLIH